MTRVIKEDEYAAKRNQIIDVAQRLIYTKGYEQMTIQDVLDGLQMSKGAFYHYFRSKTDLMEALLDRMLDELELLLQPIVDDPDLPALEKLRRYFTRASIWKTERKVLMLALVRTWYSDENTVVRNKLVTKMIARINPMLAAIVHQGLREGVMTTHFPDQVGGLIYALFQSMGEPLAELLLSSRPAAERLEGLESTMALFSEAAERILGAPPGSLPLADVGLLAEWVEVPAAEAVPAPAMIVA
jgi:TetR/AcrR family transcriptional repressor of nem operon